MKKVLREETIEKLVMLNKVKIDTTRNITSHDYESIDPAIVYAIVKRIVNADVINELKVFINELAIENIK